MATNSGKKLFPGLVLNAATNKYELKKRKMTPEQKVKSFTEQYPNATKSEKRAITEEVKKLISKELIKFVPEFLKKTYYLDDLTNKLVPRSTTNLKNFHLDLETNAIVPKGINIYDLDIEDVRKTFLKELVKRPRLNRRVQQNLNFDAKAYKGWTEAIKLNNVNNLPGYGLLTSTGMNLFKKAADAKISEYQMLKVFFTIALRMRKSSMSGTMDDIFWINTHAETITSKSDFNNHLASLLPTVQSRFDEMQGRGSGWQLVDIDFVVFNVNKYKPLGGSSYIELPDWIQKTRSTVNVQNDDQMCFKYAILSALYTPATNPQRVSNYKHIQHHLDFSMCDYPMPINSIWKFEKENKVCINVYSLIDVENDKGLGATKEVFILKKSYFANRDIEETPTRFVNLLYVYDDRKRNGHYVWIKNLSGLVNRQIKSSTHHKKHICPYCFHPYTTEIAMNNHLSNGCLEITDTHIRMPEPGTKLKFKNFKTKLDIPYRIYADFESILVEKDEQRGSYTKVTQQHVPCGFAMYMVRQDGSGCLRQYRGKDENDTMQRFYEYLELFGSEIKEKLYYYNKVEKQYRLKVAPLVMTPEDVIKHNSSTHCHICEERLTNDTVRDHDHETGKYRGAAHNACNVNYNIQDVKIPVIFHNMKNYDSKFIIKHCKKQSPIYKHTEDIKLIALNSEKFMSITMGMFRFIDSCQFLSASLDELSSNLKKGGVENFKHTLKYTTPITFPLLTEKGIYPYEYMNSFQKFENDQLPPKDAFSSSLTGESITDKEYEHGQNVWKALKCKNLGDYHDVYLRTDVLLLADVFESFVTRIRTTHKLNPLWYISLPSYSWDCMLYNTKVELDLMSDYDMQLLIERGIRGGVSLITGRHAKANNKYMKQFNEEATKSYITYLDANNLYAVALCKKLPHKNFKWVEPERFSSVEAINKNPQILTCDSNKGYFLKVDLKYPPNLHDLHQDLPLAPENLEVQKEELSRWANQQLKRYEQKLVKVKKLIPTLKDKEKYVIHSENLAYYLQKGLVLTKIHDIIEFEQSAWVAPYIEMNSRERKKATHDWEKDLYKLLNNAIFGKTMENIRNRVDMEVITDNEQFLKRAARPRYKSHIIIDEDLTIMENKKQSVEFNKPTYVGQAVLDLSKLHMYKFHYDYIKQKYGNKSRLLFTDTDSLCYHIETEDFYKDIEPDKLKYFDTSNFPEKHSLFSKVNEKKVGVFKEENGSFPIVEFIGIRAKQYSIYLDETYGDYMTSKNKKANLHKAVCKGIKKAYFKKNINHSHYQNVVLNNEECKPATFSLIRSKNQTLYTMEVTKTSLINYDDKRYIYDGINSYPYGHYKIEKLHADLQAYDNEKWSKYLNETLKKCRGDDQ